ncbi:MAG TPA: cytochrome o ubiquinol oxidase subunit IV [Acidocella sp.]|jgi:cytochrome o ubiquinol oxidase operon protein cyoD|nr:cytochrome o ubiquinol oxidase subunit IV [Acidocella sp.]
MSPSQKRDFATYGIGYLLAVVLTLGSFACVFFRLLPQSGTLIVVFTLAFVQVLVHLRCFLHMSPFRRAARDDLLLLLFSAAIIMLIVGGTLVILFNERARMM